MKTLVCSSQPALFLSKSSPWKLKHPTLPTKTLQSLNHQRRPLYAQANAKGFGNAPVTIKETPTSKSSNENGNGGNEEIPQVVFERMLVRIVAAVGLPMATGLAFLYVFGYIKEQNLWDVPLWLPFLTTLLTFGTSALGLAYGALSSSWDSEKKGSLLGWEEAQQNWVDMWREEEEESNNG